MEPDLTNEQISNIVYRMHDIRATQDIQINPLFISYSHTDTALVDTLGSMLTDKGVRYRRDIHHATAGKLEKQVDRAMRLNPTVLIVLSEASVNSDWVEHEIEAGHLFSRDTVSNMPTHDPIFPGGIEAFQQYVVEHVDWGTIAESERKAILLLGVDTLGVAFVDTVYRAPS